MSKTRIIEENLELELCLSKFGLKLDFETCNFDKNMNKTHIFKEFRDNKGTRVRISYD